MIWFWVPQAVKTDHLMRTHRTSRVSTDLLSASHITIHPCQNLNPDALLPLTPDWTSPNGATNIRLLSCPRLDWSEIPLLQVDLTLHVQGSNLQEVYGIFQAFSGIFQEVNSKPYAVLSPSVMSDSFVSPWTIACQAPLSMGFPRQEYWSGLPFPSPGDLPNPGIKPMSPALASGGALPLCHQGSPIVGLAKWVQKGEWMTFTRIALRVNIYTDSPCAFGV